MNTGFRVPPDDVREAVPLTTERGVSRVEDFGKKQLPKLRRRAEARRPELLAIRQPADFQNQDSPPAARLTSRRARGGGTSLL